MRPTRIVVGLIVLPCLLAGAQACDLETCDAPAVQATEAAADADDGPLGPSRLVDEGFNEVAAQDDGDYPDLKVALAAVGARTDGLAPPRASAPEAALPQARDRPSAASLAPALPALTAFAILLFAALGCVAFIERKRPRR